jgi:hypothetical protein
MNNRKELKSCYLWPLEVEYATRLVGSQGHATAWTNRRLGIQGGTCVRRRETVTARYRRAVRMSLPQLRRFA